MFKRFTDKNVARARRYELYPEERIIDYIIIPELMEYLRDTLDDKDWVVRYDKDNEYIFVIRKYMNRRNTIKLSLTSGHFIMAGHNILGTRIHISAPYNAYDSPFISFNSSLSERQICFKDSILKSILTWNEYIAKPRINRKDYMLV